MLLVTFEQGQRKRIGILDRPRAEVVDLAVAPGLPRDMQGFIESGDGGLRVAREVLAKAVGRIPVSQVRLMAPVPRPCRNIVCVGKNYREHAAEVRSLTPDQGGDGIPQRPIFFTKATSSVIGSDQPIPGWLDPTQSVDYEGELAVVLGIGGRGISARDVWRHVYGYTILNDVTSRKMQRSHQQWYLGKSLDGFCPMGPALVTADEVPDPTRLRVQTRVNGELRQDATLSELIFAIPELIETLSGSMTLEAGDIVATGTPAGVGMGFKPPRYLNRGDRVAVTIEPIGTLRNTVA